MSPFYLKNTGASHKNNLTEFHTGYIFLFAKYILSSKEPEERPLNNLPTKIPFIVFKFQKSLLILLLIHTSEIVLTLI